MRTGKQKGGDDPETRSSWLLLKHWWSHSAVAWREHVRKSICSKTLWGEIFTKITCRTWELYTLEASDILFDHFFCFHLSHFAHVCLICAWTKIILVHCLDRELFVIFKNPAFNKAMLIVQALKCITDAIYITRVLARSVHSPTLCKISFVFHLILKDCVAF